MRPAVAAALLAASLAVLVPARAGAAHSPAPEQALLAPLADHALLLGVRRLPDGHLVAVGDRGEVLLSDDGGATWRQADVPTRAMLNAVYFVDAQHGWAVGHDEVILRTEDGGRHFTLVHEAPEHELPLLDVWFADARRGLAVGAYSTVLATQDGGRTWAAQTFTPKPLQAAPGHLARALDAGVSQPHLYAIADGGDGHLYLAGEAGHLYRSDDAGASWLELASPYQGTFFGLLTLGPGSLLAFGLRGHLYRSDDAGLSWQALQAGTSAMLAGATRLADGTVVIAGLSGAVLTSGDGRVFRLHQEADRSAFDAVAGTAAGVVLVGESGARRLSRAELGR